MSTKCIFNKTFLFILFVFIFSASSLFAQRTGTIQTKDGSVFENVSFKKNERLKRVSFLYLDQLVYINFVDISKILNAKNQDISKIVLGVYYDPESKIEKNKNKNEKAKREWLNELHNKPWKVSCFFQTGYTLQAGKYYDGFNAGGSYNYEIAIAVAEEYSLRFSYSNGGIRLPDNFILFESNDPSVSILDQTVDYDTKRYYISLQMHQPLYEYSEDQSYFYGYAGFGFMSEKMLMNVSILETNTNLVYSAQSSLNESYESLRIGFGVVKIMTPHIGFNTEFSFDVVGAFQEEIDATLFDFKIGLSLLM